MNKPREFNLEFSDLCYDDWDCKVTVDKGTDSRVDPYEKIRVVEYSALTSAQEMIDKLEVALFNSQPKAASHSSKRL